MLSCSFVSNSLQPHRLYVAHQVLLSMGFSRLECWSGLPCPPQGDLPNPGIQPRPPTLQADSLSSEPPGKPKNTGVGSLSLLQGNFLTQELNRGLLHCWQILYQLSHQGSPENTTISFTEFIPRSSMATSALRGKPSVSSLGHQGDHHLILAISNTTKKLALWKILKN